MFIGHFLGVRHSKCFICINSLILPTDPRKKVVGIESLYCQGSQGIMTPLSELLKIKESLGYISKNDVLSCIMWEGNYERKFL